LIFLAAGRFFYVKAFVRSSVAFFGVAKKFGDGRREKEGF
jgi:hypothetical protein